MTIVGSRPWEDKRGPVQCTNRECEEPHFVSADQYRATFADYFEGRVITCTACGTKYDLFAGLTLAIDRGTQTGHGWLPLPGMKDVTKEISFTPGEDKEILLRDLGIPDEATVLQVIFDAIGEYGCYPLELEGFSRHDRLRFSGKHRGRLALLPATAKGMTPKETTFRCYFAWAEIAADDHTLRSLVAAYGAFDARWHVADFVVPANVAAETALTRACTAGVRASKLAKNAQEVKDLLRIATYFVRMSFLLPLLATRLGIAELPAPVRNSLNTLRQARNDLGHEGVLGSPLTWGSAAPLLAAATVAFYYEEYLVSRLGA